MKKLSEETIEKIGSIASFMSILMYVSYIPQIMSNLSGSQGNPIQPAVACVNCIFWTAYGFLKKEKDWPIIWANIPGIFLGAITVITSIN